MSDSKTPGLGAEVHLAAQNVIVRYAACIDDRAWDAFRDCFAKDVELLNFTPEPMRGIDAWVEFVRRTLAPYSATQHLVGPPRLEADGAEVRLRAALQAQHFFQEPRGRILTVWGVYRSSLVEADGAWRIRRHQLDIQAMRITEPPV